jgi:hypothetical protein
MQTDVVVMITWVRTRTTGGIVFPPLIRPFLRDFMAAIVVVDELSFDRGIEVFS